MAKPIFNHRNLYHELRKLIPDLPERCTRIALSFGVNEIAMVTCEFVPTMGSEFTTTKVYELREKEACPPSPADDQYQPETMTVRAGES